uniref:Ssl1-like domain-containing protein n=1 Tax=Scylla olivacea TaxID=85551 RepID=A0A0P4WQ88_SCYOL
MQEEEDPKEYRWESGYEKTWETIQEDESGRLEPSVTEIIQRTKRRKLLDREASVRLGIMRHVYIILDYSQAMTEQDLKPTRQICTLKILEDFIKEFHDQNPISQLGIITTQNKVAKRNSDLSNNPQRHLDCIKKLQDVPCRGEPSLQNALEVALSSLRHLPPHTSREILIIYAALTTCDPGEIIATLQPPLRWTTPSSKLASRTRLMLTPSLPSACATWMTSRHSTLVVTTVLSALPSTVTCQLSVVCVASCWSLRHILLALTGTYSP